MSKGSVLRSLGAQCSELRTYGTMQQLSVMYQRPSTADFKYRWDRFAGFAGLRTRDARQDLNAVL